MSTEDTTSLEESYQDFNSLPALVIIGEGTAFCEALGQFGEGLQEMRVTLNFGEEDGLKVESGRSVDERCFGISNYHVADQALLRIPERWLWQLF
jgi:hypothetical protein